MVETAMPVSLETDEKFKVVPEVKADTCKNLENAGILLTMASAWISSFR